MFQLAYYPAVGKGNIGFKGEMEAWSKEEGRPCNYGESAMTVDEEEAGNANTEPRNTSQFRTYVTCDFNRTRCPEAVADGCSRVSCASKCNMWSAASATSPG